MLFFRLKRLLPGLDGSVSTKTHLYNFLQCFCAVPSGLKNLLTITFCIIRCILWFGKHKLERVVIHGPVNTFRISCKYFSLPWKSNFNLKLHEWSRNAWIAFGNQENCFGKISQHMLPIMCKIMYFIFGLFLDFHQKRRCFHFKEWLSINLWKMYSFCYLGSITKLHLRRNKLKQNRGTCLKKEANKIKFNQTWRFYTNANLLGIIKRFNTLKINNLRCHCHTSYDWNELPCICIAHLLICSMSIES